MRLMDRITQARSVFNKDPSQVPHHDAIALAGCPLRYVLTKDASEQCADLIRTSAEMFSTSDQLLRLPAPYFWLEWFAEMEGFGTGRSEKLGALVQADEDGRAGCITPFWNGLDGETCRLPGKIRFDLDSHFDKPERPNCFRIIHGEIDHLNSVLSHTLLELDDHWAIPRKRKSGFSYSQVVQHEAQGSWFYLPFILAFAALLNSEEVVDQLPSNLTVLNASRARRNRGPLLDHIEITMRLGDRRMSHNLASSDTYGMGRQPARLHFVRGHVVNRGNKTFWRTSHLRGDKHAEIHSKTVSVHAGSAARQQRSWYKGMESRHKQMSAPR